MANWIQRALMKMAGAPAPAPSASTASAAKAMYSQTWSQMWLSGNDAGVGRATVYSDSAMGHIYAVKYNTWAGNCVNARAQSVASVPIKLYRVPADPEDDPEEVADHPAVALLQDVNPVNLDKTSYREQIQRQKAIHGDSFTLKVRGSDKRPAEMYILPAHLVTVISDPRGFVAGYKYGGEIYALEDVIRDYYPDDADPRMARSPTALALESINRYNLSDIAQEAIDTHGGQGGGIVSFDFNQIASDEDRFKAEWRSWRSDPRHAGSDAFLPPGAKYESGVLTAQQQQREERSHRLIKEIMAAYSVPPSLAGDYSDASVLANAAQQNKNFWDTWAIAECKHFAETLTYYLLWQDWPETKDAGLYLAPDFAEVSALAEDQTVQAQRDQMKTETTITALQGGAVSVNEARASLGYDPIDDPRADDVLVLMASGGGSKTEPTEPAPEPAEQTEPAAEAEQAPEAEQAAEDEPASKARLMPFYDAVGMTAMLPDGTRGTVEAVKRFGTFGSLTATTSRPVVIVSGKAVPASDIQLEVGE